MTPSRSSRSSHLSGMTNEMHFQAITPYPPPLVPTLSPDHYYSQSAQQIDTACSNREHTPQRAPSDNSTSTTSTAPSRQTSSSPTKVRADPSPATKRQTTKTNVALACVPCKKSHLACDTTRPCRRCCSLDKAGMCEDVPHKRRGRRRFEKLPATNERQGRSAKVALTADTFARRGTSDTTLGRRVDTATSTLAPPSKAETAIASTTATTSTILNTASTCLVSQLDRVTPVELFEIFTSPSFQIIRVTPSSLPLTGFHPHEFLNLPFTEFLHPSDRHLVDMDRVHLFPPHILAHVAPGQARETQAAMLHLSIRELLSPAEGAQWYPNHNVRVLRADSTYEWFNVRMHVGGGLGAVLGREETMGRGYLVISLLLLQQPETAGGVPASPTAPDTYSQPSRACWQMPQLAPHARTMEAKEEDRTTEIGSAVLPSFSSLAAGVEPLTPAGIYYHHPQMSPNAYTQSDHPDGPPHLVPLRHPPSPYPPRSDTYRHSPLQSHSQTGLSPLFPPQPINPNHSSPSESYPALPDEHTLRAPPQSTPLAGHISQMSQLPQMPPATDDHQTISRFLQALARQPPHPSYHPDSQSHGTLAGWQAAAPTQELKRAWEL